MNKKETLAAIKRAGNSIINQEIDYTCWALQYQGIKQLECERYWQFLMHDPEGGFSATITTRLKSMGYSEDDFIYKKIIFQRLIMLAWLHALVETGDLDTDFNWKK